MGKFWRSAKPVTARSSSEVEETGAALGIAPMTVKRDWRLAKTWLRRAMSG